MGSLGISVFLGMGQSLQENLAYMMSARTLGYSRIFTSLHIPEADSGEFRAEGRKMLTSAGERGYKVTADISPRTWSLLGLSPEELVQFGVDTLRADWGFSPTELKALADRTGLKIEINASTTDKEVLVRMLKAGFAPGDLRAGHNYYPRPETGLSYALFRQRSRELKDHGIEISAFIPNKKCHRGPMFFGLPTIEAHRRMTIEESARQYWASRCIDTIFFGDPLSSEEELAVLAAVPREAPEIIELRVRALLSPEYGTAVLWAPLHTNRMDASALAVRSQESRNWRQTEIASQPDALPRRRGDITVDNFRYGRYAGEMQIVLQDLPADEKVNVVGQIAGHDLCLLDCLEPGRSFCLKEVT